MVLHGFDHADPAHAAAVAFRDRNHGSPDVRTFPGSAGAGGGEEPEMKWLWEASDFVRKIRIRMRFGETSRMPLRLLRLELRHETAVCEWIAPAHAPWDRDLPLATSEQKHALQA